MKMVSRMMNVHNNKSGRIAFRNLFVHLLLHIHKSLSPVKKSYNVSKDIFILFGHLDQLKYQFDHISHLAVYFKHFVLVLSDVQKNGAN